MENTPLGNNYNGMALLIEVEDELHNMDKALEQLAGHGHASW